MNKEQFEKLLRDQNRDNAKSHQELLVRFHFIGQAISNLELRSCNRDVHNDKSYHYIPFPPCLFTDILLEGFFILGMDKTKRFLDVGCGVGTTVLLAQTLFDAYGFDYNSDLVTKASFLVGERAFQADAMSYDAYGEWDFIYYYRFLYEDQLYLQFETMIHDALKPGAIVCPIWELFDWSHAPDMEQVGEFTYQRIPSKE